MVFDVTHSVMALFIRFGCRLLIMMLRDDSNARVAPLLEAAVRMYLEVIKTKYPLLGDVYAMADGLKLRLEASWRSEIQNVFYNGWTHDHYVSCVFVFSPAGTIIACAVNAPGCMHDSQIAEWGNVYETAADILMLINKKWSWQLSEQT
jgi:hypothetical protein